MADISKLDHLYARLAEAHAQGQAHLADLDARRTRPPTPGDVYLFLPADEYVCAWVVANAHPHEPEYVYVVPADEYPRAGLSDVPVRDGGTEPLFVRCGRGQWVPRADLKPENRYRVLDAHHVRRVQRKLKQITTGPLDGPSSAWEDESDPDYRDWMANVTATVLGAIAQAHRGPDVSGRFAMTRGAAAFDLADLEVALAAMGDDEPAEGDADEGAGEALPFDGPGRRAGVREPAGVSLVFEPDTGAAPPAVSAADAAGAWRALSWEPVPGRAAVRLALPWIEGRVRLRVGVGDAAREHTVSKS